MTALTGPKSIARYQGLSYISVLIRVNSVVSTLCKNISSRSKIKHLVEMCITNATLIKHTNADSNLSFT